MFMQKRDGEGSAKPKPKPMGGLPPPPGGVRLAPPGKGIDGKA